jgi:hypothetical protein
MGTGSILFRPDGSSALKQIGTDKFRIWINRSSIPRSTYPWGPFLIAYHPGDAVYRPTFRPINWSVPNPNVGLTDGSSNVVTFSALTDITGTNGLPTITLTNAKASSGLPVQYWVAAGPYRSSGTNGEVLVPEVIPPKTKFPMEVTIGAWQWGRPSSAGTAVPSAYPVFQTFYINPASAIDEWRYSKFGTYANSGDAADTADPDRDGRDNALEFQLQSDPNTANLAGRDPYQTWARGTNLPGSEQLHRYSFGANSPELDGENPQLQQSGTNLVLQAVVRTNDAALNVLGEYSADLFGNWTNLPVNPKGVRSANTNGVPPGCERREFVLPMGNDSRKFLRINADYNP